MTQPTAKRNNILFWVFTILFCAFMMMSTIPNILSAPEWVEVFKMLGYPLYMLPFIGVAKLLGVIALLVPGFPRIKEWAYAGMFFDLTGAVYSGLMTGGFNPQMLIMLVPFVLGGLSYMYHHKKLKVS
ncbi:MAG: DoxX family protein [Cyclobacteriaceae bacterium]|nr:MAG: DoxX family protein [Cyclobacteriaceae bacterium]